MAPSLHPKDATMPTPRPADGAVILARPPHDATTVVPRPADDATTLPMRHPRHPCNTTTIHPCGMMIRPQNAMTATMP